MTFKENFQGKKLLKSIGMVIYSMIYVIMFFMMGFPQYAGTILIVFFICILLYWGAYERFTRRKEGEIKGKDTIGGWAEHYQGVGEPYYFYDVDIQPIERLSESDRKAVDDFVKELKEQAQKQIKIEVGSGETQLENKERSQPQLTYQEIEESEKEFMEKMVIEYKKFKEKVEEETGENKEEIQDE